MSLTAYQGIDGASVVMCTLAKPRSGDDHAITAAAQPMSHEQSQPFNVGIGKGGNWGEKQGRDTMLDFAFHFPLKLEFLYCRLSPHTINANGTIDNEFGV